MSQVNFKVTQLAAQVAEGVPLQWQGKEFESGRLTVELDESVLETANRGVLDYSEGRAKVEFRVRLAFPEFASTLESLGVDPGITRPVCALIHSEGEILKDHSFVLSGPCEIAPHELFTSKETYASVLPGH
jgi:hypothetical protein